MFVPLLISLLITIILIFFLVSGDSDTIPELDVHMKTKKLQEK